MKDSAFERDNNMKNFRLILSRSLSIFVILSLLILTSCDSAAKGILFMRKNDKSVFTQRSVVTSGDYQGYGDYTEFAKPEFLIPGLSEGFIPQGMDVWAEKSLLLISGYFKNTFYSPSSVIFAIDIDSGEYVNHYHIKNPDGTYHTGHAGGIAVTTKNLFISNDEKLLRIPLSQISELGSSESVIIAEEISVPVSASFCNYSRGMLWVGDFHNEDHYPTPKWRHITDDMDKEYAAWAIGYSLNDSESEISEKTSGNHISYATPDVVLAIPDHIQGITVTEGNIFLSQSYGRKNDSSILIYDNRINTATADNVELNGERIPVWFLSDTVSSYNAPPMSQALTVYDGILLILYESGASYYRLFGAKAPTDHVWGIDLKNSGYN